MVLNLRCAGSGRLFGVTHLQYVLVLGRRQGWQACLAAHGCRNCLKVQGLLLLLALLLVHTATPPTPVTLASATTNTTGAKTA